MVLRLLMIGMCAACVVVLVSVQPLRIELAQAPPTQTADRAPPVSVVDVASRVAPNELPSLLRLEPHEWVSEINDQPVGDGLPAEALIAELAPKAGGFLDLKVLSGARERRVLLLVH
jgi:hypothetical protein